MKFKKFIFILFNFSNVFANPTYSGDQIIPAKKCYPKNNICRSDTDIAEIHNQCAIDLCGKASSVETPAKFWNQKIYGTDFSKHRILYKSKAKEAMTALHHLIELNRQKNLALVEKLKLLLDQKISPNISQDKNLSLFYSFMILINEFETIVVEKNETGTFTLSKKRTLQNLSHFSEKEQQWLLKGFETFFTSSHSIKFIENKKTESLIEKDFSLSLKEYLRFHYPSIRSEKEALKTFFLEAQKSVNTIKESPLYSSISYPNLKKSISFIEKTLPAHKNLSKLKLSSEVQLKLIDSIGMCQDK